MLEVDIVCGTYQTCQKKARGYKMSKKYFCHYWFCTIHVCGSTKSCLTLKIMLPRTISKVLSFESISVVISQKLNELDQFKIGPFFSPHGTFCSKLNYFRGFREEFATSNCTKFY